MPDGGTWPQPMLGESGQWLARCLAACQGAAFNSKFARGVKCGHLGHLNRHQGTAEHRAALEALGLAAESGCQAPSADDFPAVVARRNSGQSLRAGVAQGADKVKAGRWNLATMQRCLAEAMRESDRACLARLLPPSPFIKVAASRPG